MPFEFEFMTLFTLNLQIYSLYCVAIIYEISIYFFPILYAFIPGYHRYLSELARCILKI